MKNTSNYLLPQFETDDLFNKEDMNNAFLNIDVGMRDVQDTLNDMGTDGVNSILEVNQARGVHNTLKERLDDSDIKSIQIGYSAKELGLISDCTWNGLFDSPIPTGTDNTEKFRNAIITAKNSTLILEKNAKYLITDTIDFTNNPINIIGNGATIIMLTSVVDKPTFICASQLRTKWCDFTISGCGYLPRGIQFKVPDNQAMEINNVKVTTCRYGAYLDEAECVNRVIFYNCDFSSNLLAGIYFKSYETIWGQSAPIHFEKVICNSNGIPSWVNSATKYNGINVLKDGDKYGFQAYFKGFSILSWKDGQISNHLKANTLNAVKFENINGLHFSGDVEDNGTMVDLNGAIISDFSTCSNSVGSVILLSGVKNSDIVLSHCYSLNGKSVIEYNYCSNEHYLKLTDKGTCLYSVTSYENILSNFALSYDGDLNAVDVKTLSIIKNITPKYKCYGSDFTTNNINQNIFTNSVTNGVDYSISEYSEANINLNNYIQINDISNSNFILVKLASQQNSWENDGKLFYTFYDNLNAVISHEKLSTRGATNINIGLYYSCYKINVPTNATMVRVGFCNSASYTGNIKTNCVIKGFNVYVNSSNEYTKYFV